MSSPLKKKLDVEPATILRIREGNNAYKTFIEAFTTNFTEEQVPVSLKVHPDGDTVTGHHAFLDTKLQGCFSKVDLSTVPLESEVNRSVRRTSNKEELEKDAFFHVRLTDGANNLDILIREADLYLVGFKRKVKKDDTETVENWILLSPAKKTEEYVVKNSTVDVTKAKLGTSYSSLIRKYDSSFARLVEEELSRDFHKNLITYLEKDKKDVINKISHAKKKLADAKEKLEKMKEDPAMIHDEENNKELDNEISGGRELLKWLGQNNKEKQKEIESMEHRQLSETKSEQVEELLNEFKTLQKKSVNAESLLKELEIIVSEIPTEALSSIDSKVLSWVNEYQKGGEKTKLLKAEKKEINGDASANVAREKMNVLRLNKTALIDAFKHLTQNPFQDDEVFAKHIINLIVMISESARFTSITDHIWKFYEKVTTQKVTTETVTTEKNTSDNVTSEKVNTEKVTTERVIAGPALSREMIAMMYRWTEASNILLRGFIYHGEKNLWNENYKLDIEKELPFVRTLNGRTELQSWEE